MEIVHYKSIKEIPQNEWGKNMDWILHYQMGFMIMLYIMKNIQSIV
mgnify:CR=1 FL=1